MARRWRRNHALRASILPASAAMPTFPENQMLPLLVTSTLFLARVEPVEHRFESDGVDLAAALFLPEGGSLPAMDVIQGSGDSERTNAWTDAWSCAMEKRGVPALETDKRGCGASKGGWWTASLDLLASDAIAAVESLT